MTIGIGLGLEHEWNLSFSRIVGRANAKFQSDQHFTIFNYDDDYQRPYITADLSATYIPNHKNVKLMAYGLRTQRDESPRLYGGGRIQLRQCVSLCLRCAAHLRRQGHLLLVMHGACAPFR